MKGNIKKVGGKEVILKAILIIISIILPIYLSTLERIDAGVKILVTILILCILGLSFILGIRLCSNEEEGTVLYKVGETLIDKSIEAFLIGVVVGILILFVGN